MKKVQKLFLLGVFCLASVLFTSKVNAINVNYQVYDENEIINLNKKDYLQCREGQCDNYIVTNDEGIKDNEVILTNENDRSDTFSYKKESLATVVVVKASSTINYSGDLQSLSDNKDVENITYYKGIDVIGDVLKSVDDYDLVIVDNIDMMASDEIIVPKNVTLIVNGDSDIAAIDKFVNNGIVIASSIFANKTIDGNGKYVLTPSSEGYVDFSARQILSKTLNISVENFDSKEALPIFRTLVDTKEEAEKFLDVIKLVNVDDYDLYVGKKDGGQYYYIFANVKENIKTTTNQEAKIDEIKDNKVKNPSTGDAIILTIVALITSGAVFIVTYKKAKQK